MRSETPLGWTSWPPENATMIAIAGAGLSGLSCALALHRRGKKCTVFEASGSVGGRQCTARHGGFTLDHGFQVVLDSYKSVAAVCEIPKLAPRHFESGAIVHAGGRTMGLCSPMENPLAAAFSPVLPFPDKLRLALLGLEILCTPDSKLLARCASPSDQSTRDFLSGRSFSPASIERFFQPFFGGVLLDNALASSAGLFLYYLKKFCTGRAWVPAGGIQALPESIAAQLAPGTIRLHCRATEIRGNTLLLESGERIEFDQAILALDEPSLHRLLRLPAPPPAPGVSVVYFESSESLYPQRCIVLPAGADRLVRHFVQITNIAPEFAPPGKHLISATVLGPECNPEAALREIAEVFPKAATCLRHIETIRVPYAVPAQPPGFAAKTPPPLPPNVHACGDWRNGASIEAAIRSGLELAERL